MTGYLSSSRLQADELESQNLSHCPSLKRHTFVRELPCALSTVKLTIHSASTLEDKLKRKPKSRRVRKLVASKRRQMQFTVLASMSLW
jgi:hypothetical protein